MSLQRNAGIRDCAGEALLRRHELSKADFDIVDKALELVVNQFLHDKHGAEAVRVDEVRKQFQEAHTGWLWFEEEK